MSLTWIAIIVLAVVIFMFIDNMLVKVIASLGASYFVVVHAVAMMRSVF
jgi:hypothetical protein